MTNAIKKNGINFGIIIGIAAILISAVLYAINLELMVSIWIGIIIFLVNLALGIVAVVKTKKALGGLITFKEAFTVFFIAMAIGSAINIVFSFILFNLIDPGAKETVSQIVIEKTVGFMQNMGTKSEDIRMMAEKMKSQDNFGVFSLLKSYVSGLVMSSIIGLIVAVAFKNKAKVQE